MENDVHVETRRELVLGTRGRGWRIASGVLGVLSILSAAVPFATGSIDAVETWALAANALICGWLFLTVARHGEARIPIPLWATRGLPFAFWAAVLWWALS